MKTFENKSAFSHRGRFVKGFHQDRPVCMGQFRVIRPRFESSQEDGFAWMARAHAQAEALQNPQLDRADFERRLQIALRRFGCSDGQITKRGHELPDFQLVDPEKMRVFDLGLDPQGRNIRDRIAFFSECADRVMVEVYPESLLASERPDYLVHVSCTGYASPSPSQRLISLRDWGFSTQSIQMYHMGCYASLPAMRQASSLVRSGMGEKVDVVHNELCTLHFDPTRHTPEQLVVESLFADGHIAYRIEQGTAGDFTILALREDIIPDTSGHMTWNLGSNGFVMTLARDVPSAIASHVKDFVRRLFNDAGLDADTLIPHAFAALHPGGPRIIDGLKDTLGLDEKQIRASREVLRECGNMSSATLPHILERLTRSESVSSGSYVFGLAFGPGLTMAGMLLRRL